MWNAVRAPCDQVPSSQWFMLSEAPIYLPDACLVSTTARPLGGKLFGELSG
jgi:hypothetical protein